MTANEKTTQTRFRIAIVVATVLCMTSAFAHGWLDRRWANEPNLRLRGEQLSKLPKEVGEWTLVEERELEKSAQDLLRCYGYNHSVYQNSKSGKTVTLAVLFGPRGPIAVHTPEICYSGRGVQAAGGRKSVSIEGEGTEHTLWKVSFLSKVDLQPDMDVFYGWTVDGIWQASKRPRFWLTDDLYKIQIAGPPSIDGTPSEAELFLKELLPLLRPLVGDSAQPKRTSATQFNSNDGILRISAEAPSKHPISTDVKPSADVLIF